MIPAMTTSVPSLIEAGRAALRAGDASTARRAFEAALEAASPSGDAIEGLARVAYLELDFTRAIETWERAYAAHRDDGDQVGAVRVARTLSYMYGAIVGDWAVSNGRLARAQSLVAEAGDAREEVWVALNLGMFEPDRARKEERFQEALAAARRVGDVDLEFVTLAYLGASLVHSDRTEEGMLLLDEALAAVAGNDVDNFQVVEEIFCQLFSACEYAHDVARADQWIRIGEAIAQRRNLPASRRSVAPTTAGSSPPRGAGQRPTPRSPQPSSSGGSVNAHGYARARWSACRPPGAPGTLRGGRTASHRAGRRSRCRPTARRHPPREG